MNYLSGNIRFLREQRGLSQERFAVLLETSEEVADALENDSQEPDMDMLVRLSGVLKVSVDRLLKIDLRAVRKLLAGRQIKLLVLDVDGVLTDGGMYYTERGDEFKKFNTKDGMAIKQLVRKGVDIGIISSGFNTGLINKRAELLGIRHVYAGPEPKLNIIKNWCGQHHYELEEIAYIGDDINDLEIMDVVGISACPADAIDRVKRVAKIVLERNGGTGCVREFVDNYLLEV